MYQFEANLYRNSSGVLMAEIPIMHVNRYFDPYNEESPSHEWDIRPCVIKNEKECCTGFALVTVKEDLNPMKKMKEKYEGTAVMIKNSIPNILESERIIQYLYGKKRSEVVVRKNTKMGDYLFLRLFNHNQNDYYEGYLIVQDTNNENRGTFYPSDLSDDNSGTTEIFKVGEYLLREKKGKTIEDYIGNTILSHYEGTTQIEMRHFHEIKNASLLKLAVECGVFEFYHCGNKKCVCAIIPNVEKLPRLDEEFSPEEKKALLETISEMNIVSNAYYDDLVKKEPSRLLGKSCHGFDLIQTCQSDSEKINRWMQENKF